MFVASFLHSIASIFIYLRGSFTEQKFSNLPTMQETLVQFLGGKDSLEKG